MARMSNAPVTANLHHFAINADDLQGSRRFYESVFGWTFTAWGPPGFYQIRTGTDAAPGVQGAMQERRELLDRPTNGVECTFAVDDVDATANAVVGSGGRIVMERFTITGVGHLIAFEDPSGNAVLAMQYDDDA
jgi:predicted enzyme related to lactoylglutathione lyase